MSTLQDTRTETAGTPTGHAEAPGRERHAASTQAAAPAPLLRSPASRSVPWGRVALVAVVGALIAGFLWLMPYDRSLVGFEGSSRSVVPSSCPVPLNAAFAGSTDRSLDADGAWTAGSPPCARSARFRVGLGAFALLVTAGAAVALSSRARSRTSPAV